MDVFDTIEALEEHVRESPRLPFTRLRAVDRRVIAQLLNIARAQIEQAQREPLSLRAPEEVLSQTENEAKLIVESARQEAQDLLSDDRIKALNRQHFHEIVSAGQQQADQCIREAYAYTAQRMRAIEHSLSTLRSQIGEGLAVTRKTTRETEKHLRQRQKEAARQKSRARRHPLATL